MPEPDFLAQQQARALHENVDADASAPDADGQQPDPLLGRRSVDKATLYGLVGSAVLLAVAVLFGGHSVAFVDLPAILIVILGTVTVTMSSFSMKDVRNTRAVLRNATHRTVWDIPDMVVFLLKLSEYARRFGVLKMQGALMDGVARQPFLHKGLEMAIDDMSYADVEAIMRQEATATHARHKRAAEVVRRAAEVAPAMGLIGTLVGLVQMLRNLDDPAAIGPGMAVALLTTFYGAIMGTMVLAPLADKLERNAAEERRINHLYILTVLSIIRRDNPRRLEILLNAVAAPEDRVSYFP